MKTRVLAENLSTPMPDSVSALLDSMQMIRDVPEYRCFAHFKYQNCVFSLPITILNPDASEDMKWKETSKLTVYRVEEDGSMARCYTSVKNGKVSFNTDHFSTYLLAEEEASASGSGTGVKSPQTGDPAGRFLWLFALSALGFWFLLRIKSKEAR